MDRVKEITEKNFRTGTSDKGPWAMHLIKTEKGQTASIFGDVEVGDEVVITVSQKGDKTYYNAKKPTASDRKIGGLEDTIEVMAKSLERIEKKLDILMGNSDVEERGDDSSRKEVVLDDDVDLDEPADLSDIPFN